MTTTRFGVAALVLLAGATVVPPPAAQEVEPAFGTRMALHKGLPAIDRGLVSERLALSFPTDAEIIRPDTGLVFEPGRVIVKYRPGVGAARLAAIAGDLGARSTPALAYANFDVLAIDPGTDPEEVAAALAARPEIEYAQAAYRNALHFTPNDPMYSSQWNFPAIDMERAWDINRGATSAVVVGVLDSGVAFEDIVLRYTTRPINVVIGGRLQVINHGTIDVPFAAAPDLGPRDRFVAPFDFTWNDVHAVDTLGHGTHVAGTIGQLTNNGIGVAGMAFNVRIMPIKIAAGGNWDFVFGAPSPSFTDDQVARSIRYAADNGAKAINMSFGRIGMPAPVVEDALRYAVSRGTFCVISAGNGGQVGSPLERIAEIASRVDGVVAVGAVGRDLNRAPYSSVGTWVELAAPGGNTMLGGISGGILQQTLDASLFASPLNRPRFDGLIYGYSQGTSMAAPHVTGFAALLIQQGITNPSAIEAAMKRYATDRGAPGRDNEYGHGIINPRATLRGLGLAR